MQLFGNLLFAGMRLSGYDLFLMALAMVCGLSTWYGLNRTTQGKVILAVIHNPANRGRRVYGALTALFAMGAAGVALRHAWLQWFPSPSTRCVGSDLEYMLNNFPLAEALPKVFAGTGECSEVKWVFLYLSIPEWALAWFVLFTVIALLALLRPSFFTR